MHTEMTLQLDGAGLRHPKAKGLREAQRRRQGAASGNQQLVDRLLAVMEETYRLANEGHTIVGLEIRDGRPVIEILPSHRLRHLAKMEHGATYIAHGISGGQRRSTGELLGRACRVLWIEEKKS